MIEHLFSSDTVWRSKLDQLQDKPASLIRDAENFFKDGLEKWKSKKSRPPELVKHLLLEEASQKVQSSSRELVKWQTEAGELSKKQQEIFPDKDAEFLNCKRLMKRKKRGDFVGNSCIITPKSTPKDELMETKDTFMTKHNQHIKEEYVLLGYHGTNGDAAKNIMINGFTPSQKSGNTHKKEDTWRDGVYAGDLNIASGYAVPTDDIAIKKEDTSRDGVYAEDLNIASGYDVPTPDIAILAVYAKKSDIKKIIVNSDNFDNFNPKLQDEVTDNTIIVGKDTSGSNGKEMVIKKGIKIKVISLPLNFLDNGNGNGNRKQIHNFEGLQDNEIIKIVEYLNIPVDSISAVIKNLPENIIHHVKKRSIELVEEYKVINFLDTVNPDILNSSAINPNRQLSNTYAATSSASKSYLQVWPIRVLKGLTTTIVNATEYWLANVADSTLQSPNMLVNIGQRVDTNNTYSCNRVSNFNYSANSDDPINIKPQEDTSCVPYIWNKDSQEYVTDYVTGCTLPHGHLKVFANIHQGDNTIQSKDYHISGDTYKNCRPIEFEERPSVYCQGKKSNMVYTANVQLPTSSLDAINAQLMLTRVFGIDKLIGELITKSKILLGLEQDSNNQLQEEANEIELAEITVEQISRWQDSIKYVKCLIGTLSSQVHQENNKQNLNWVKEASFILEDRIKEVNNYISKQQSLVNVEEITELDKKLECLQIDLEGSFNLPNSSNNQLEELTQNNSQQQESNSMYGSYPTYEHLVHNMSVLHADNTDWCPNTRDFSYMTAYQYTQIAHNASL